MGRRSSESSLESYHSYMSTKRAESIVYATHITNLLDIPNTPPPLPPHPNEWKTSAAAASSLKPDYEKILIADDGGGNMDAAECVEIYAICEYVPTPQMNRVTKNTN